MVQRLREVQEKGIPVCFFLKYKWMKVTSIDNI